MIHVRSNIDIEIKDSGLHLDLIKIIYADKNWGSYLPERLAYQSLFRFNKDEEYYILLKNENEVFIIPKFLTVISTEKWV
jgi:hypothetical protein